MSQTSGQSSSCCLSPSSENGRTFEEEIEAEQFKIWRGHNITTTTTTTTTTPSLTSSSCSRNGLMSSSNFLTFAVFEIERKMYGEGLHAAQTYLLQTIIQNKKNHHDYHHQGYHGYHHHSLYKLIPILLLADVESSLGSILPSYMGALWVRRTLENLRGKNYQNENQQISILIYWTQRLEIKILNRGRMFERARAVTCTFYENYKTQMMNQQQQNNEDDIKRPILMLENQDKEFPLITSSDQREHSDSNLDQNHDLCHDFSPAKTPPPWAWTRLIIMADLLSQLRRFDEALHLYEKARDKIVSENEKNCLENLIQFDGDLEVKKESGCGNYFWVQNKIIKLFIKMRHFTEALEIALPLLNRQKLFCGEEHFSVLKTTFQISLILKHQGDYRRAIQLAENVKMAAAAAEGGFSGNKFCHNNFEKILSPKLESELGMHLAELRLFLHQPNLQVARANYVLWFQKIDTILGGTHPFLLDTRLNLGKWFTCTKNVDRDLEFACQIFEKVYQTQKQLWGDERDAECLRTKKLIRQCRFYGNSQIKSSDSSDTTTTGSSVQTNCILLSPLEARREVTMDQVNLVLVSKDKRRRECGCTIL